MVLNRRIKTRTALAAGVVLGLLQMGPIAAAKMQSLDSIAKTATEYVAAQITEPTARIHVGALDKRLRLARCGKDLQAFSPPGRQNPARRTVGIRCTAPNPWTLFVPVEVSLPRQVLVATRSLSKGDLLSPGDLKLEQRDVARMSRGYLTNLQAAVGKRMKRPITANRALTPDMVEAPDAVARGERVTILAAAGGLQVRMAGEALSAGARGERIRVRNSHSRREVEATVVGPGLVKVTL